MDSSPSPQKKDWLITREAFDKLLSQLDPDRERAGEVYEKIRQKLMKFFKWRGCSRAEEYADRAIDRAARRISEGAELRGKDPYLYFYGVALNVLREHWKNPQKEWEVLDDLPPAQGPYEYPGEARARAAARLEQERRLECLNRCVQALPPESLDLITQYHQGSEGLDKRRRKALAGALRIPLNALRIRAYRIRTGLEKCVEACFKRPAE